MNKKILLSVIFLIFSCQSPKKLAVIKIIDYDWCSPNCDKPISAFKFNDDGTFNASTSMFGGISRWGNWERQGKDKIKLITTKISTNSGNDRIPDPQIITIVSGSEIQIGSTVYKRN